MIYEYKITKQVEFSHTDMAGIMHFSNFYRFMEAVEHDMVRSFGKSIVGEIDVEGNHLGWPRVNAECSFYAPLKFEDTVELHLVVREIRNATMRYEVIFNNLKDTGPIESARGFITVVFVKVNSDGKMSATPLPKWFHSEIEVAPDDYMKKSKK